MGMRACSQSSFFELSFNPVKTTQNYLLNKIVKKIQSCSQLMMLIHLAIPTIVPIAPMIAVIDVITPKTIPRIPPILSASPLPARMSTQRKKDPV